MLIARSALVRALTVFASITLLGALAALFGAGCSLPRDADGTLARIRNGPLRVGVVVNPPWVVLTDQSVVGIEGRLSSALASSLRARVEWITRPEFQMVEALRNRDL